MKKLLSMLIILTCLVLTSCGDTKVDLLDYVSVEFSGYDGVGIAEVEFDEVRLKLNLENNSNKINEAVITTIINSISATLDTEKELSNEDSVNLTLKWNDELANDYGFKFSGDAKSYTVTELTERIVVDLFKDVEIILSGVSPYSKAVIQNNSTDSKIKNVSFTTYSSYIANGDTITVNAFYTSSLFNDEEYTVLEKEKEFTVSGADEYIKKFESMDEDAIEKLKTQAEDILTTQFNKTSNYTSAVHGTYSTYRFDETSIELISRPLIESYFLAYKDGLSSSYSTDQNLIYLVYEMTVLDATLTEPKTIYPVVRCKKIIERNTGETYFELSDVSYYKSFEDLDTLKADIIDSNKAKYDYQEINL